MRELNNSCREEAITISIHWQGPSPPSFARQRVCYMNPIRRYFRRTSRVHDFWLSHIRGKMTAADWAPSGTKGRRNERLYEKFNLKLLVPWIGVWSMADICLTDSEWHIILLQVIDLLQSLLHGNYVDRIILPWKELKVLGNSLPSVLITVQKNFHIVFWIIVRHNHEEELWQWHGSQMEDKNKLPYSLCSNFRRNRVLKAAPSNSSPLFYSVHRSTMFSLCCVPSPQVIPLDLRELNRIYVGTGR